jgi:Ca2+-binding RTX toxin-like protein
MALVAPGDGADQVHYHVLGSPPNQIEEIRFSDGTVWTSADLRLRYLSEATTIGDDVIRGFYSNDVLDGGAGDDRLEGGDGSDAYVFGRGSGHDVIQETIKYVTYDDDDRVNFADDILPSGLVLKRDGNSSDLVIEIADTGETLTILGQHKSLGYSDVEEFHFSDGTVWTDADVRQMLINQSMTAGDNIIYGFFDNDTYSYNLGGGNDTIYESYDEGAADQLVLGEGILASEVTLTRSSSDLDDVTLGFKDGGSVFLNEQFNTSGEYGIERIVFGDGTVWTKTILQQKLVTLPSTDGDDSITGFNSTGDTIEGGLGNDTLDGLDGSDTYLYKLGDGNDTVNESYGNGSGDQLVLGEGILPSEVTLTRSSSDLDDVTLTFADGGSVFLNEQFNTSSEYGIENIVFADGPVWDKESLKRKFIAEAQTAGNDTVNGFADRADTIEGGLGNDTLDGLDGSDTYLYKLGDGNDTINESYGNGSGDQLVLGEAILSADVTLTRSSSDLDDVTLTFADGGSVFLNEQFNTSSEYGIETIVFADGTAWDKESLKQKLIAEAQTAGNDTVNGFADRADTIEGGLGNDTLNGLDGNDTYLYKLGDGNDTVNESYGNGSGDQLVLGEGILPSQVTVARSASDLDDVTLTFADGGSVFLNEQFNTSSEYGIEMIVFADGTMWDKESLKQKLIAEAQTAGNDTVNGFADRADTIEGGQGNDTLDGLDGNDTYLYKLGDGNDTVNESYGNGSGDQLVLGEGILPSDVTLTRSSSDLDDVTVTFADGGSAFLNEQFNTSSEYGIETIVFADGTAWTKASLQELAWIRGSSTSNIITGTSSADKIDGQAGNDTLNGGSGADIIIGGIGDDALTGGAGSDTFVFTPDFGKDTIADFTAGAASEDIIQFDDDVFADFAAIVAAAAQVGSDTVIAYDANNVVTLKNVSLSSLHQDDFQMMAA